MSMQEFRQKVAEITGLLAGLPVEEALTATLEEKFPPRGEIFSQLSKICRDGVREGWLADREANGLRYGRAVKASPETHGFSVDVVEMKDIAGPFHAHPHGEIDMILPIDEAATFDGAGEGWLVYGPNSRHAPTVRNGRAIIMYLLPEGAIDFKAVP